MIASIKKSIFQPTVALSFALMGVIVMMVLPVPTWMLDLGLALSFALAILMFTITLFIERPLDFSIFPTVLLASLILRLSLNVSSTKLIIGEGHTGTDAAGDVIESFAMFVMNGNVTLGIVVFSVLLIVNFVVINKGATRMAEVGARFALDAMPGKQIAIDSDMAAGVIDHDEAKRRRDDEQQETNFFGSLDGASKFVKGDAIAGLLITILNLVVGLLVGVGMKKMPIGDAFETYSILTVGDGLVSQIPAVIISISSALLLARGGSRGVTDLALSTQLGRHPSAIATVSFLLALFALIPGFPFLPFFMCSAILAFFSWKVKVGQTATIPLEAAEATSSVSRYEAQSLGDLLELDDIHIEFSPSLVEMVLDPGVGLNSRILNMRNHVATTFGILLPDVRLTDNVELAKDMYLIHIHGVEQARDFLFPNCMLALIPENEFPSIGGSSVLEPVYGAPARWIGREFQDEISLSDVTVVQPAEVLATHLLETVKNNFSRLMTHKALRRRLDEMTSLTNGDRAEANRKMLSELMPEKVSMGTLLSVTRMLLDERVSIRNLAFILEAIAEVGPGGSSVNTIVEHVREKLGFQLVAGLKRSDGTIPLIQIASDWEEIFLDYEIKADKNNGSGNIALPPADFNRLADRLQQSLHNAALQGIHAAVVTSVKRRRFIATVLAAKKIVNPVLSFDEIGLEARPTLVGLVEA